MGSRRLLTRIIVCPQLASPTLRARRTLPTSFSAYATVNRPRFAPTSGRRPGLHLHLLPTPMTAPATLAAQAAAMGAAGPAVDEMVTSTTLSQPLAALMPKARARSSAYCALACCLKRYGSSSSPACGSSASRGYCRSTAIRYCDASARDARPHRMHRAHRATLFEIVHCARSFCVAVAHSSPASDLPELPDSLQDAPAKGDQTTLRRMGQCGRLSLLAVHRCPCACGPKRLRTLHTARTMSCPAQASRCCWKDATRSWLQDG